MLRLTFLGTSAGVPTKQRNVTALAVECLNPYAVSYKQSSRHHEALYNHLQNKKSRPWLLIDCGEGTQQQLLHTKLSLRQLIAIGITHIHGDHCYGLPGLLASAAMSGRAEPLIIIAPKAIARLLDVVTLTTELYFPFAISFMAIEDVLTQHNGTINIVIDNQHHLDIDITSLSHRVPSHAFGITQTLTHSTLNTAKLKADGIAAGVLWGKLQQGEDVYTDSGQRLRSTNYVDNEQLCTRIVVAGDNDTPACLASAMRDTDLLVHEATYTSDTLAKIQARIQPQNPGFEADFDPRHSSAQLVGKFAQEVGLNNLILTHFSARYQSFDNPDSSTPNMSDIRMDAQGVYKNNLWLAADFAQYLVKGADNLGSEQSDSSVQYLGSARD